MPTATSLSFMGGAPREQRDLARLGPPGQRRIRRHDV